MKRSNRILTLGLALGLGLAARLHGVVGQTRRTFVRLRGWRIHPDGFCQDVCEPNSRTARNSCIPSRYIPLATAPQEVKRVARTCVFRSAACPSTDGFLAQ